jgi:hypothetical protein
MAQPYSNSYTTKGGQYTSTWKNPYWNVDQFSGVDYTPVPEAGQAISADQAFGDLIQAWAPLMAPVDVRKGLSGSKSLQNWYATQPWNPYTSGNIANSALGTGYDWSLPQSWSALQGKPATGATPLAAEDSAMSGARFAGLQQRLSKVELPAVIRDWASGVLQSLADAYSAPMSYNDRLAFNNELQRNLMDYTNPYTASANPQEYRLFEDVKGLLTSEAVGGSRLTPTYTQRGSAGSWVPIGNPNYR